MHERVFFLLSSPSCTLSPYFNMDSSLPSSRFFPFPQSSSVSDSLLFTYTCITKEKGKFATRHLDHWAFLIFHVARFAVFRFSFLIFLTYLRSDPAALRIPVRFWACIGSSGKLPLDISCSFIIPIIILHISAQQKYTKSIAMRAAASFAEIQIRWDATFDKA